MSTGTLHLKGYTEPPVVAAPTIPAKKAIKKAPGTRKSRQRVRMRAAMRLASNKPKESVQ
jgi:hypothetical protein